jgi:flagellar assembly protein FliH
MSSAAAWAPPRVSGPLVTFRGRNPDASELEKEARAIAEAGFQRGRSEGLAAAAADVQAKQRQLDERIAMLDRMLQEMARPLDRLDDHALQELTILAIRVGGELARRELAIDPAQVSEIIRHCSRELPLAQREIRAHLNPLDIQAIRSRPNEAATPELWMLIADPTVARGGCRIIVGDSRIDATLDERLRLIIEQSLGDGPVNGVGDITADLDSEEGR